jgi:eukaryotic-like serine/threonine-protein kinase
MKTLEPGSQLGRYELLTPIAQGGMATVWAARQSGSHGFRKTVALKVTLPSLSEDPQFERMFLSEGRLAMRVHHPNVVETLDLGEVDGLVYLVMEWVDGESLSTLMKASEKVSDPLSLPMAIHICARAARGLHAAHSVLDDDDQPAGIVHRDVSPQNIMISFDGHVKVVDFGVAKSHMEYGGTQAGQFKGKVPYMAPEQASGEPVDARTDVFAMGTLLYRLTTGKHPFLGGTEPITLANIVSNAPIPPTDVVEAYPPELEQVVLRCLRKKPSERFPSMAELAAVLDKLCMQLGGPISEEDLGTFTKRHLADGRKRRREAMRDAAKSLGWALATSDSLPRVSLTGGGVNSASLTPSASYPARPESFTPSTRANLVVVETAPGTVRSGSSVRPRKRFGVALGLFALAAVAGSAAAILLLGSKPTGTSSTNAAPSLASTAAPSSARDGAATSATPDHYASVASSSPATSASSLSPTSSASAPPPARPLRGPRPPTPPPGANTSWGSGPDVGF